MKILRVKKADHIADNITIDISGAKNALLHIIFACLIPETKTELLNVPITLLDYKGAKEILEILGSKVTENGRKISIDNTDVINKELVLDESLASKTRCSLMLLGSMLKRCKKVKIGFPGGCSFSDKRPFDIHLEGLSALGVDVAIEDSYIFAEYTKDIDSTYYMPFPSVGATMNLVMFAVKGSSTINLENVALEPEVVSLIDYLNKCGAKISFDIDKRHITVKGVNALKGCSHPIIFDRIQAMTYAAMAYLYKTDVTINNINQDISHIHKPLEVLSSIGAKFDYIEENQQLIFYGKNSNISGIDIIAAPFPNFPTDLQPIFAIMLIVANSASSIKDTVYPDRIKYVFEIQKMGFDMHIDNGLIKINPLTDDKRAKIVPASMSIKDLRAGMACLMAGGLISGYSTIENAHQIFRGYDNLYENVSNFVKIEILD